MTGDLAAQRDETLRKIGRNLVRFQHPTTPEQFAELKKQHGKGSLQRLVAAIGLFEISTESTPAGGTRTLYRLRAEAQQDGEQQAQSA